MLSKKKNTHLHLNEMNENTQLYYDIKEKKNDKNYPLIITRY